MKETGITELSGRLTREDNSMKQSSKDLNESQVNSLLKESQVKESQQSNVLSNEKSNDSTSSIQSKKRNVSFQSTPSKKKQKTLCSPITSYFTKKN